MPTEQRAGLRSAQHTQQTKRLAESRVTMLGLAALDDKAVPDFDRATAARLADLGMKIAALTPEHFADWLADAIA